MAKCRICDSKIDQRVSVCPVCGCPNPSDNNHKTSDLIINSTDLQDLVEFDYKKKKKAVLFTIFLDIIGLGRMYLGHKNTGFFFIFLNICLIVASFFVAGLIGLVWWQLLLIVLGVIFLFNLIHGLIILFTDSVDANGDLLE
ncbi:MAG: TM2 domain-containing protein [Erysipelotrichales bacterium]|nr:TM2 domain-containing protein [Erysipelotrichales bacterium]